MLKKTVFGIMLLIVVSVCMSTMAFDIQRVKADSGTIYIVPDGRTKPSTANITTSDHVTHTFTANNYEPIVVQRSNMTIDGAGHALRGGGGGNGTSLNSTNNVTMKNANIEDPPKGVYVENSTHNKMVGSNVTANSWYGVDFYYSSFNSISVTISPSEPVVTRNSTFVFTATVAGGTPPYQYDWTLSDELDVPVASGTGNPWNCTVPTWAYVGTGEVDVYVTDSQGVTGSTTVPAVILALSVSVSPASVTLDVGQSQLFTSAVLGSTSPYSYQWYMNGALVSGATSATWTFTPVSAGPYTVFLNVNDSSGMKVWSNTASVTVNSHLVVPTVAATPATVDQGQSSILSNSTVISTGTSPYAYRWLEEAPSASSYSLINEATSFNYAFSTTTSTETGLWSFVLRVTDATGAAVNSTTTNVTVYFSVTFAQVGLPTGTLWNATFNGVTESSTASQIVFTAIATGSYSWSIGTPISGGIGIRYTASQQSGSMYVPTQTVQSITFTNQYCLTVDTSPLALSSPTGQGWYDSGTNVTVSTDQYVDIVSGNSRYRFDSWTGASGTYSNAAVVMNSPETATANYMEQYNLTFAQSGVGIDFSGTVVTVNGTGHNRNGVSFWADSGNAYNFAYGSPLAVSANQKQYVLSGVSGGSTASSLTVSAATTVTGTYERAILERGRLLL